jgi:hypothetical protein
MLARIMLMLLVALSFARAEEPSPAIGTWEGESLCTVPSSPCHNEHVVYEIKADPKSPGNVIIDAFKIVSGEKLFMGALGCTWRSIESSLACHYREDDDWSFKLTGNKMEGTLHIKKDRQLYRKISVTKK